MATPEGWTRAQLGAVLDGIDAGWSPQCSSDPAAPDAWGVLKVSAVTAGTYLDRENKALPSGEIPRQHLEVKPGDLLLARANGVIDLVGRTVLVRSTRPYLMLSDKLLRLRPRRDLVEAAFLNALLSSVPVRDVLVSVTGGSHMRNISQDALRKLSVLLPPLPEQRKIAAILSAVDEVIEKTEAVIQSLQALKKAMMQELLTRGLPGRHTRFKQTEIGEVPEGWEVVRVEQIGAVAYGLTVNAARRESTVRRPYLTVANLQEDGFILDEVKEIGVLDNDGDRYECRAGDVLVVEGNANPARLGRSAVWRDELPGALHQNHLIRIRPDAVKVVPDWLSMFINASAGRMQIEAAAKTSSGLHTINSKVVGALCVALPSITEQRESVAQFSAIDAARITEETCLADVRAVKSALMSVLLTGELRVTPDKDAA